MRLRIVVLSLALACAPLAADVASAAPASLPTRPLDVELRGADIKNVFRLLAEVSGKSVLLDDCVHGKVDIRLANAPIPLVYDAIGSKLGLAYEERGGAILVHCASADAAASSARADDDERLATRVTIDVRDVPLDAVLGHIVANAKLEGVEWRTTTRPKVTMTLGNVRTATALAVLADTSGLGLRVVSGKLQVVDR